MFKTSHDLPFEVANWLTPEFTCYRVGTCEGIYTSDKDHYIIVAVINSEPGNGHLTDVLEWFENSCIREKKHLKIAEVMNRGFYRHLIEKRGFKILNKENVIKKYNTIRLQNSTTPSH